MDERTSKSAARTNHPESNERTLIYIPIIHTQADMGALSAAIQRLKVKKLGRKGWERNLNLVNKFHGGNMEGENTRKTPNASKSSPTSSPPPPKQPASACSSASPTPQTPQPGRKQTTSAQPPSPSETLHETSPGPPPAELKAARVPITPHEAITHASIATGAALLALLSATFDPITRPHIFTAEEALKRTLSELRVARLNEEYSALMRHLAGNTQPDRC